MRHQGNREERTRGITQSTADYIPVSSTSPGVFRRVAGVYYLLLLLLLLLLLPTTLSHHYCIITQVAVINFWSPFLHRIAGRHGGGVSVVLCSAHLVGMAISVLRTGWHHPSVVSRLVLARSRQSAYGY